MCTKKNKAEAERCVTCSRPRGHQPESDTLKRALDPAREVERRKERAGLGYGDDDDDDGGGDGFIGWGAMLSTLIAVVALLAAVRYAAIPRRTTGCRLIAIARRVRATQVYVAGTEEFQEFASEAKSIITWRCWTSNVLFALARWVRGSIDDEQCPSPVGYDNLAEF